MNLLLPNQTCIFHIKKMCTRAQTKYQKRFHLTSEADIVELIHFTEQIRDIELRRHFMLFYINCPPETKRYLDSEYQIQSPVDRYNIGVIASVAR